MGVMFGSMICNSLDMIGRHYPMKSHAAIHPMAASVASEPHLSMTALSGRRRRRSP
jgi:hypothetical protein